MIYADLMLPVGAFLAVLFVGLLVELLQGARR